MNYIHRLLIPCARLLPVLLVLLMQGCASFSKDECNVADWRLIGYQDGVAGKSAASIGNYRKACAKHAVVPDFEAWQAGRAEGLMEYCRAENGYRLGRNGKGYPTFCPAEMEPAFRAAYDEGHKLYFARSAVRKTKSRISQLNNELDGIEHDKKHMLTELISEGLTSEQRVMILYDLGELKKEKDVIKDELHVLYVELEEQQHHLDNLNRQAAR